MRFALSGQMNDKKDGKRRLFLLLALSLPLADVPVGIHLEVGALFLPRVFVLEHDGVIE